MAADLDYNVEEIDDVVFKMKSFKNEYIESSELDDTTSKISNLLNYLENYSSQFNNCMSDYNFSNYKRKISGGVTVFKEKYLGLYTATEHARNILNLGTANSKQILNQFSGVATYGNSSSITPSSGVAPNIRPKDDEATYGNSSSTTPSSGVAPNIRPKEKQSSENNDSRLNGIKAYAIACGIPASLLEGKTYEEIVSLIKKHYKDQEKNRKGKTNSDTNSDQSGNGTSTPYITPKNDDSNGHKSKDGSSKDPKVDEEEEKKRQEEEKKRQEEEKKRQEEEKKRQEEEKKRQEEEKKRQEEEKKRKEEEKKRKEEEKKQQEKEKKQQEEERRRQEEERKRQEEERKRQEEERRRQEEERRRQEEQNRQQQENSNTGSDIATPSGSNNNNNSNYSSRETASVPNTETTDNPVAAGIETSTSETATSESASTSVVGDTNDLFKNKPKNDPKTSTLPKSESSNTSTSSSGKGFNPVPIAVGLGAAVAGGVGLKAYKDHKENAKFDDENEDSFSNGNRFWTEEDPNVINSEESVVSGDELFEEQTTSPSYSAMANEANTDGGWSLDETSTQPEEAFDLLGDN